MNRIRFIVGIFAITFASSNCMKERRGNLVYGSIGEHVQRAMEKAPRQKVLGWEQRFRMLEEEKGQRRQENIKVMFAKWDDPMLQRQLSPMESEKMILLSATQAQFVRGRDTTLGLLEVLEKIKDPSMLVSVCRTLRNTIVLGFKEGLSVELIQKLLPIMSNVQENKGLFPYIRRSQHKRVVLLNDDGEEMKEELESVRLARLLKIKRAILETFRAWNAFMIQEKIPLPAPLSSEVSWLNESQQQFVEQRNHLLGLLREKQVAIEYTSSQDLREKHTRLEDLVDLGCSTGLSAQVIERLLQIGALQAENRKHFASLVRPASHAPTPVSHEPTKAVAEEDREREQKLAEFFGSLKQAWTSGYHSKEGNGS